MTVFLRSFVVELEKIFRKRKYMVLMLIQLGIFGLIMLAVAINSRGIQSAGYFMASGILNVMNHIVTPLLAFMLAADIFPQEFENTSIKVVFLRPVSRTKIFISKVLAIPAFLLINLLAIGLLMALLNLIGGFSGSFSIIVSFALSVLPCFAFAALGVLIALLVGNSSLAMFLSLIVYIAMLGLMFAKPILGSALFTSHLNFYKIFLSAPLDSISTLLMFMGWTGFLSVMGLLLFERKEI